MSHDLYMDAHILWPEKEETIEGNIKKLGKRYEGFKYSNQAAQDRADKV